MKTVAGWWQFMPTGEGRSAVYYANSQNLGFTPGYIENTGMGQSSTPTPTPTPIIDTPQPPEAGWTATEYTYTTALPHAVSAAGSDTYTYDANGNMTCRVEEGLTYVQTYNAENRLHVATKLLEGTCQTPLKTDLQWDFAYDGDGNRMKQVVSAFDPDTQEITGVSVTSYFMGGLYEETDGTATVYYAAAGMTVAMSDANGLKYLLKDHLGSVVAVTDVEGTLLSQQRYLPFGQIRTDVGLVTQTDFAFTGQRAIGGLGLMDYKARMYDPVLGRFTQPDTIVPNLGDPQIWNLFASYETPPSAS
jgi:RHS repeat-associated protein